MQVDEALMRELRELASAAHLSQADVHRQALRFGLPVVREKLAEARAGAQPKLSLVEHARALSGFEPDTRPVHCAPRL